MNEVKVSMCLYSVIYVSKKSEKVVSFVFSSPNSGSTFEIYSENTWFGANIKTLSLVRFLIL